MPPKTSLSEPTPSSSSTPHALPFQLQFRDSARGHARLVSLNAMFDIATSSEEGTTSGSGLVEPNR
jgi:hypothetical protein